MIMALEITQNRALLTTKPYTEEDANSGNKTQ